MARDFPATTHARARTALSPPTDRPGHQPRRHAQSKGCHVVRGRATEMGGGRPASLYRDLSFQARSLVLISPRAYPHRTEPPSETLTPGSRVEGRMRAARGLRSSSSWTQAAGVPVRSRPVPSLSRVSLASRPPPASRGRVFFDVSFWSPARRHDLRTVRRGWVLGFPVAVRSRVKRPENDQSGVLLVGVIFISMLERAHSIVT